MFWADQLADKVIERAEKEGRVPNIKCQETPSGGKHIGNLNDVMRAYFVYKSIILREKECEFVHMTDDRDPLKGIPLRLVDLNGVWHNTSEFPDLKKWLGKPLFLVPDPFGCCSSWAEHFTNVWKKGLDGIGVYPMFFSVNKLYKEGKFEPYIKMVFEKRKLVGEIISKWQRTKSKEYIPFDAICPKCKTLSNVDDFDLDKKMVHITCRGKPIKGRKTAGCGFEGWVPWSEGKLQWRFEWPALWGIFNTTYEPFGKDHAEGSWPSGKEIMKRIYEKEPPIPFVYEFFLVDGRKMSASVGNVFIPQDMVKIMEPEAFNYFYTKRPEKQRDFELAHIFRLVDEFDEAERIYFGKSKAEISSPLREENTKRMYEMTMNKIPKEYPNRISYAFAATLMQLMDEDKAIKRLKGLGHVDDKNEALARDRLKRAHYWVTHYAAPEFKIEIISKEEAVREFKELTPNEKNVLTEFASVLDMPEEEQIKKIQEITKTSGVKLKRFFQICYALLLGRDKGPRLVPFIGSLDKNFVKARLRGET